MELKNDEKKASFDWFLKLDERYSVAHSGCHKDVEKSQNINSVFSTADLNTVTKRTARNTSHDTPHIISG